MLPEVRVPCIAIASGNECVYICMCSSSASSKYRSRYILHRYVGHSTAVSGAVLG